FFQAEDGIRDRTVTGVQTCALPISVDLGPASDARFDAMSMQILFNRLAIEAAAGLHRHCMRARTDQRHVAAHNIDKLRQLVEARSEERRVGKEVRWWLWTEWYEY